MIRLTCPKCQRKLTVDDAKAGAIGACPGCGHKFKIPGNPPARAPHPSAAPPVAGKREGGAGKSPPASKASPQSPPANPPRAITHPSPLGKGDGEGRVGEGKDTGAPQPPSTAPKSPEDSWRKVDHTPYAFQKETEKKPPPELEGVFEGRRKKGFGSVTHGTESEQERHKRAKGKKTKEPELMEGVTYFKALLLASALGWATSAIYSFMMPGPIVIIAGLLFGLAICVTGFMWFLYIALKGSVVWVGKPLLITFMGISIMGSVLGIALATGILTIGNANPSQSSSPASSSVDRN